MCCFGGNLAAEYGCSVAHRAECKQPTSRTVQLGIAGRLPSPCTHSLHHREHCEPAKAKPRQASITAQCRWEGQPKQDLVESLGSLAGRLPQVQHGQWCAESTPPSPPLASDYLSHALSAVPAVYASLQPPLLTSEPS